MEQRTRTPKLAWTLAWMIIILQFGAIASLLWMHQGQFGISEESYPSESPQDRFLGAYLLVQLADRARDRNDWFNARRLYAQAGTELDRLKLLDPEWEPALVEYRWRYVIAERRKLEPGFAPLSSPLYAAWSLIALAALLTCLLALIRLRRRPAEAYAARAGD